MLCSWARTLYCASPHPQEYKWVMGIGKLSGKLGKMLEERGGGGISCNRNWDELYQFTSSGASFTLSNNQKYTLNLAKFHTTLD